MKSVAGHDDGSRSEVLERPPFVDVPVIGSSSLLQQDEDINQRLKGLLDDNLIMPHRQRAGLAELKERRSALEREYKTAQAAVRKKEKGLKAAEARIEELQTLLLASDHKRARGWRGELEHKRTERDRLSRDLGELRRKLSRHRYDEQLAAVEKKIISLTPVSFLLPYVLYVDRGVLRRRIASSPAKTTGDIKANILGVSVGGPNASDSAHPAQIESTLNAGYKDITVVVADTLQRFMMLTARLARYPDEAKEGEKLEELKRLMHLCSRLGGDLWTSEQQHLAILTSQVHAVKYNFDYWRTAEDQNCGDLLKDRLAAFDGYMRDPRYREVFETSLQSVVERCGRQSKFPPLAYRTAWHVARKSACDYLRHEASHVRARVARQFSPEAGRGAILHRYPGSVVDAVKVLPDAVESKIQTESPRKPFIWDEIQMHDSKLLSREMNMVVGSGLLTHLVEIGAVDPAAMIATYGADFFGDFEWPPVTEKVKGLATRLRHQLALYDDVGATSSSTVLRYLSANLPLSGLKRLVHILSSRGNSRRHKLIRSIFEGYRKGAVSNIEAFEGPPDALEVLVACQSNMPSVTDEGGKPPLCDRSLGPLATPGTAVPIPRDDVASDGHPDWPSSFGSCSSGGLSGSLISSRGIYSVRGRGRSDSYGDESRASNASDLSGAHGGGSAGGGDASELAAHSPASGPA